MAGDRPVKCPGCGEYFRRSETDCICIKGRFWHVPCYEASEYYQKDKISEAKKSLDSYICELFKIDTVSQKIRRQINKYMKNNNFSYSGIEKTLRFFYDVKKNSLEKSNGGIGIVPYVYNDARDYYYQIFLTQQQNQEKDIKEKIEQQNEVQIIKIKRPNKTPPRRTFDFKTIEGE